jgi:hypothetical protein
MRMSTLAAAAMAYAAYKYLKRQRTPPAADVSGMQEDIDRDLGAGTGLVTGTGTGTGTESPNAAERLQPAGVAPRGASTDQMFGSSSQQGSEPIGTGLPDLTRGA